MDSIANLTQDDAYMLRLLVGGMTGGGTQQIGRRGKWREKLESVWPEILTTPPNAKGTGEKRKVVVDAFEKRALGEGLLAILKDPRANTNDWDQCRKGAKLIRIEKWYLEVTLKGEPEPFEGQSDDEPDLGDEERAAAPGAELG